MITISVETICAGLGHWNVSASDGEQTAVVSTEWEAIQAPLDEAELKTLAILILRSRYAGIPINGLSDLFLNGATV